MLEIIFLFSLAIIWMIFGAVADLKYHIVPNWLNFSLIIFALGARFFYSLFSGDFNFFYQGLIGLGIFLIIGNALYYGRMFSGGDAKLMIALGTILPTSEFFSDNLEHFAMFLILFLFTGAIYGFGSIIFFSVKNFSNFKKQFLKQIKKEKSKTLLAIIFGTFFLILGLFEMTFFYFGMLIFLFPYLYFYAKAVDESCMVKIIGTRNLTEGDWLCNNLKIGKKTIKSKWEGLSKEEIKMIRKKFRNVKIRDGVPFEPTFLIAFLIHAWFLWKGIGLFELFF